MPPALVIQGTGDVILPTDMADNFAVAYRKAGGLIELRKFEGQPHTFITKEPAAPASLKPSRSSRPSSASAGDPR